MTDPQPKPRLLVIGLDGATFDLLTPMVQQGWLPNIKRVLEQSAHGVSALHRAPAHRPGLDKLPDRPVARWTWRVFLPTPHGQQPRARIRQQHGHPWRTALALAGTARPEHGRGQPTDDLASPAHASGWLPGQRHGDAQHRQPVYRPAGAGRRAAGNALRL